MDRALAWKHCTRDDFVAYYGGLEQWREAPDEPRRIADDGQAYTRGQFHDFYGGLQEWAAAGAACDKCNGTGSTKGRGQLKCGFCAGRGWREEEITFASASSSHARGAAAARRSPRLWFGKNHHVREPAQ